MPDITMCNGKKSIDGAVCKIKDKCFRFTAAPDPLWQSYFQSAPFDEEGKDRKPYSYCGSFWGYDNFGRSTCKR
jgi:hypothetical protein